MFLFFILHQVAAAKGKELSVINRWSVLLPLLTKLYPVLLTLYHPSAKLVFLLLYAKDSASTKEPTQEF